MGSILSTNEPSEKAGTIHNGLAFQRRTSDSGVTTHTSGGSGSAPQWFRLTRIGNDVFAYAAAEGNPWSPIDNDTINLGSGPVLFGLAVTAHDNGATASATFDNVTVVPWIATHDIGSVTIPGDYTVFEGVHTITGSGADVWGTSDAFRYAYRQLDGDGTIVARLSSFSGPDDWSKAGVMLRQSTDPASVHAFMLLSRDHGLAFQRRATASGVTTDTSGITGSAPRWLRLTRTGNVITGAYSSDGITWTDAGSEVLSLATGPVLVGIAVVSHDDTATATASFDSVSFTP